MNYLISLCVLAAGISLAWVCGADEPGTDMPTVAVETLLPANCFTALTYDGTERHLPAIKETAAWKALEETELTARLLDIAQMFVSAVGEENGVVAREAIEHLRSHGLSVAGSLTGSGEDFSPYGVIVLHGAGRFLEQLEPMLENIPASERQRISNKTIEGRSISVVIVPETPDVEVSWWNESGHLVIGVGIRASEQVIATAMGKTDNISQNPKWVALRKSDRCTIDCFGWVDTGRLLDQFAEVSLPPMPSGDVMSVRELTEMFGVHNIRELTMQSGYQGARIWSDVRLNADGPLTGLASLLQQRTLSLTELPPMPKGSTSFAAAAFDLAGSYDTVLETIREFLGRVEPRALEDMDGGIAQMEAIFGGDPRKELIAGLGDVWCIYADPAALPIPLGFSPVVSVSVKDKDILVSGIGTLMDVIQEKAGDQNFSVRKSSKDGREYFSLNLSGMPLVPTIVVSDKWLAASLTPGSVQSLAQRESGKLPSWTPTDQVAEALKELPKEFSSITVTDPAPTYQQALLFAPMGLNLLEQQVLPNLARGSLQMPFGVEDLPTAELVTEPMFPNVSIGYNTPNGIASTTRQSVPSNPFGNVSAGVSVPILVALLLPAVQQAREAARRTQSKNNLKMMGLAMHNYHDTFNKFPRGTVENDDLEPDERLSWGYSILPYLDQANLYNQLDAESGWEAESNLPGVEIAVPVFQNPSQPGQRQNPSASDYVAMAGVGEDAALLENNDPMAGIFGYNRDCGIRDITDGTSNTIMITDSSEPNASFLAGGKATIRSFSQSPYLNGPDGIGSPHTGGVQMLLADGSVRFVSVNIDESVLEALATKAGGEAIGEF